MAKFAYGADIGWMTQFQERGVKWVDQNGQEKDLLLILKDYGIDAIRLRVFVDPPESAEWDKPNGDHCLLGYADAGSVVELAKKVKAEGMRLMIDFHYSDHFADPEIQDMPAAWTGHSYEQLLEDVHGHTKHVMGMLAAEDIYPEWVQVGNEINHGMMWPAGGEEDWHEQLAGLLNIGYDAVKEVSPESRVITHLAEGQDNKWFRRFFDNFLTKYNGKTDIIGISYYPYWLQSDYTETIDQIRFNLKDMYERYGKEIMVCEVGGDEEDEENSYQYLMEVFKAIKAVPDQMGTGVFYWEPQGNRNILTDGYPLGATRVVAENTLQFTKAMDAYRDSK